MAGKNTESPDAVVFRGDGEPKTPELMVSRLTEIADGAGIEADNYSLGGVVEQVEKRMAEILDKEAAVFMPTGTLANHLAIRNQCGRGQRAIVQEQSHIYHDIGDCVQQLSGINLIPLAHERPYFRLEEVKAAVETSVSGRVLTPVGALVIESPVRRQHGQIMPFDVMREITEYCAANSIHTHLDGARLFMMSAATGISPAEYSDLFDTVYVSLYKYFGAPFGAILAGTEEFCRDLYHDRRMFGGGLSSASLAAALALEGMEGFEERFTGAMSKAERLFSELNRLDGLNVESYEHGSNIFPVALDVDVDVEKFIEELANHSVFVNTDEGNPTKIHLTVNTTILRQSNEDISRAFEAALNNARS
jgi:threonine aldolase